MAAVTTSPGVIGSRLLPHLRQLFEVVAIVLVIGMAYRLGRRSAERACERRAEAIPSATFSPATAPAVPLASDLPADTVTSTKILDDYSTNEIRAHQAYSGHAYHVLGTIVDVRNIFDAPVLVLAGADALGRPSTLFTLNAFLPKDEMETASRFLPGDNVLLQCNQSAKIGVPYISGCVFVSGEPASKSG